VSALELKVPPVALVLILGVAMWLVSAYLPWLGFTLPWSSVVAVALIGLGVIVSFAGVVAFRKAKTTVNPAKPSATSAMVSSGVYRLSRNPMYVGLLFALTGWAAFLSHTLAFACLPVFVAYMNRFQISPEESALSAKFGAEFAAYMQSVRRWL
jgi:protein-S-isoprenylcysteine O-methyltransferase Ste14